MGLERKANDRTDSLITQQKNNDEACLEFELMGTQMRVLVGPGPHNSMQAALSVKAWLENYNNHLSRFISDSELNRLNNNSSEVISASPLLISAIEAALSSAKQSEGLVDPTLLPELEAVGYKEHWDDKKKLSLDKLPEFHYAPASANASSRWKEIIIDHDRQTIKKPPGVRIDNGGSGKGHAADEASILLKDFDYWAVDCGGDIRIGGTKKISRMVEIISPFDQKPIASIPIKNGAVATSGIYNRLWLDKNNKPSHHLLDPSNGEPAWTGIISASAIAKTALEAETLAKMALLSGPEKARELLTPLGGAIVHQNKQIEKINLPIQTPKITFRKKP